MRNVKYIVEFEINPMLNGDFDFKDEALAWAKEHISEKPIVRAIDVEYPEEFGQAPIVHEEEEIFHYPVEEEEIKFEPVPDDEADAIIADLERYADEMENDPEGALLHRDFPQYESLKESNIESEINQVAANWDAGLHEELPQEVEKHEEPVKKAERFDPAEELDEDVILFDPFGCDFSECEPMEVCADEHRADCCDDFCQSPADFLRELAAELGIADEVEISEISDEAKDPEDVVPEEVKANEEPNVEVQGEDEKPAEEIAKCHVCSECGKEICECNEMLKQNPDTPVEDIEKVISDKTKTPEEQAEIICETFNLNYFDGRNIKETDYNKVIDICLQADLNGNQDGLNLVGEYDDKDNIIRTIWTDEEGFLDVNPEDEDLKENKKCENKELVKEEKEYNIFKTEDPEEAFNIALEIAKRKNKDVIYGYHGSDHHSSEHKYFFTPHIVCDDLKAATADYMKRYHPSGSILVAHPDDDFIREAKNCELEDKMLFMEDKEMSDLEFAEAFKKGLEEKHCKENLVEQANWEDIDDIEEDPDIKVFLGVADVDQGFENYYAIKEDGKYKIQKDFMGLDGELEHNPEDVEEFDSFEELKKFAKELQLL